MLDAKQLLEQFLGGNAQRPADDANAPQKGGGGVLDSIPQGLKGFGGGMAAGGLAGLLLGGKGGRKMVGKAAKVGGMAVLGGLAYKAYRDWQDNQSSSTPSSQPAPADPAAAEGTPFLPAPEADRNALGVKLLQAMIAAAKADGHIDAQEQERIFAKLDEAGLGVEEKGFLMDELRRPLDIDAIVALADNDEQAVEIYAASRVAIDPDEPAEQAYLTMLAARLKIAPELRANIDNELAAAMV